jgi:hypothetical protein
MFLNKISQQLGIAVDELVAAEADRAQLVAFALEDMKGHRPAGVLQLAQAFSALGGGNIDVLRAVDVEDRRREAL